MLGVWMLLTCLVELANISWDKVAHFAHLGGALTGFIIVLIWNKTNRKRCIKKVKQVKYVI